MTVKTGKPITNRKMNKFYCAATRISSAVGLGRNDYWTKPSMDAAVKHAETILEENPDQQCIVIVKIVAVVKRQKQPVRVQVVR